MILLFCLMMWPLSSYVKAWMASWRVLGKRRQLGDNFTKHLFLSLNYILSSETCFEVKSSRFSAFSEETTKKFHNKLSVSWTNACSLTFSNFPFFLQYLETSSQSSDIFLAENLCIYFATTLETISESKKLSSSLIVVNLKFSRFLSSSTWTWESSNSTFGSTWWEWQKIKISIRITNQWEKLLQVFFYMKCEVSKVLSDAKLNLHAVKWVEQVNKWNCWFAHYTHFISIISPKVKLERHSAAGEVSIYEDVGGEKWT